ncbi:MULTISPECIES: Lar family restriction alleviation protein [Pseudomonas]|uniref:Lar family restriction alleviation protein n=1 Tax=Pseudomonas TaxID=286 RepID=UPI0015F82E31|nr:MULTISPECIES: Lar family restriction alleviation protein [Pseudomonas]MBA6137603.1 restriction alleviation protein, Lar family [Pseudomonas monteilii]MDT3747302.1 Lar family restriction alleviation protein [Pseudomonas kurunegalensis]
MNSDQTLAPCPFCGGPAIRFTVEDDRDMNHGADVITCDSCAARTRPVFRDKAGIADLWNRRAPCPHAWLGQAGLYRTRLDAIRNGEQSVTPIYADELFELARKQVLSQLNGGQQRG